MVELEVQQWFATEREYGIRWIESRGIRDAEDVIHNALLAAIRAYRPQHGKLRALYRRILYCRINDELRKLYLPEITEPLATQDIPHEVQTEPLRDDWRDLLKSILRLLDAKTTRFLHDHHVRGKSILELSEIHGASLGAVKQRCFRSREQARAILHAHGLRCMDDVESFRVNGRPSLPAPAVHRGTCRENRHPHAE